MVACARSKPRLLSLALALLLGACAVGGPLRLAPDAGAPGEEVERIAGAEGHALPLSLWQAEAPEAVILAVHGFGDYGPLTFEGAARHWAAAGITTYAYDQRGFGRGETFGVWPGADALIADLGAVARAIRARHPCTALIVVGHSMGGGVALAAAGEGLDADGIVLAAPAIWGGDRLNPLHRTAAWLAAAVAPEKRFTGKGIVRIQASDNIELLQSLASDPRYLRPPSAREILGLVRITDRAAEAASDARLPALLLLGGKDEIVPAAPVREVFATIPGLQREIVYPEGWHLLFRDLQAARVWQDVAGWALERAAGLDYASRGCPVRSARATEG